MNKKDIIIALDFDEEEKIMSFLNEFNNEDIFIKIGMEMFFGNQKLACDLLSSKQYRTFLDLKLHDIPNTVARALTQLSKYEPEIITLHCSGGYEMLKHSAQIIKQISPKTKLVGVTLLTSISEAQLHNELQVNNNVNDYVIKMAQLAFDAGLDGIVSSPQEATKLRELFPKDFLIITPGIRMESDNSNDQKRVMSPEKARELGINYIVVGRPITNEEKPKEKYNAYKKAFLGEKHEC